MDGAAEHAHLGLLLRLVPVEGLDGDDVLLLAAEPQQRSHVHRVVQERRALDRAVGAGGAPGPGRDRDTIDPELVRAEQLGSICAGAWHAVRHALSGDMQQVLPLGGRREAAAQQHEVLRRVGGPNRGGPLPPATRVPLALDPGGVSTLLWERPRGGAPPGPAAGIRHLGT